MTDQEPTQEQLNEMYQDFVTLIKPIADIDDVTALGLRVIENKWAKIVGQEAIK